MKAPLEQGREAARVERAAKDSAAHERSQGAAFDARLVRRLLVYIRPHQRLIWTGLALLLVGNGLRLAGPAIVMQAIDRHLTAGHLGGYFELVALFVAIALAEFVCRRIQIYAVDEAGQNSLYDLRLALFRHLQRLPSRFYDRTPIGRLVGRVTTDIEALQEMFSSGVVTILGDFVFLGATVVILLSLQWKLALATFVVVPVLIVVTLAIRIRVRKAYVVMRRRLSALNAYLHEQIGGMDVVQAFGRENLSRARFGEINHELCGSQLTSVRWESALSAIMEMLGSLTVALILWYGSGFVVEGGGAAADALTIGALFAFIDYMQRFFQPLNDLSLKYTVMQNAMTASDRIFSLLDEPGELSEPAVSKAPSDVRGAVEFKDVVFGYDPAEPVLMNVSFRVAPGETVALVGATGAGKSSVLKLLSRLYEVQGGHVLLDDVDVRDYPQRELRRRIGVVSQDVFLFEGDILSNIKLGARELSDEEALAAAKELHLDQVVGRFPAGFAEPVRERGRNLSSGERQLVSFARVLAQEPSVLLLDEATSNVDTHTEHLLQDAVRRVMRRRTSLIVAHRLSTIRDADRIIVFQRGRIVEEGTHEALLELRGIYWRLYELQYREQERAVS